LKTKTPPPQTTVYDAFAPHYERALRPLERLILARLRADALCALDVRGAGGLRLLEIGAGTGLNFPRYPPGACGAATEPSREMLRLAQTKPRPTGVRLVQASAEALPFADNIFDAAFATLVFCSVVSPSLAFAELRRVVRAGGRVVLLEHVRPAGLPGYVFDALSFFTVRLFDDHFNRRTAREAQRAGLRVISVEPHALGIIQLIVCEV
jgi:ubiquinone/menaquinone biosynthesis C-methylase UbiE